MAENISRYDLERLVEDKRWLAQQGELASYIPELKRADPLRLGVSITTLDGKTLSVGHCQDAFSLQSISKVLSLIMALMDNGFDNVFSKVGMEPSGEPFNSISKLETMENHIPLNPMINSGAIAVSALIKGDSVAHRFERVLNFIQKIADDSTITLNEKVYFSEKATGDRNRSLAYFMKSTGVIETDVDEALDLYFRLCSINVTCCHLSRIGAFLANKGVIPGQRQPLVSEDIIRVANTIMFTAGMYNESGESAIRTGIPAKSGVSGGILAVAPGRMGIGIIGPAINKKGNSIAGLSLLSAISKSYDLHLLT
ncbi:glutaminase [Pullulanibacillus camelliae]|uniref:Glutaminase n=1 Tax=Pullulanibacillus camelliae TaxID=1707096 RepID=A0A8J2YGJ9_9BACL|nr:glutaminase A [Pullulanibacillus camelliae]GGE39608.1 glutaminase [Pullulanibacillus camelliae]